MEDAGILLVSIMVSVLLSMASIPMVVGMLGVTPSVDDDNMYVIKGSHPTFSNVTSPVFVNYILSLVGGGGGGNLTASDVWNYMTRTLTNLNNTRANRIDLLDVLLSTRANQSSVDTIDVNVDSILSIVSGLSGGGGDNASTIWNYTTRLLTNLDNTRASKIDNLDVLLSTRATQSSVDTIDLNVDDIKTHADYIPSNIATSLGYIPSTLSSDLTDIKTHTDYIPSNIATSLGYIPSTLSSDLTDIKTHADYIPSNIATLLGNIDVTVSSRATQTSVDIIDTNVDSILGYVDTEVATIDTVVDTINGKVDTIDTNVDSILGYVDTEVATIDTVVDTINGKVDIIDTNVDSILGYVDTEVATIDTVVDSILTAVNNLPTITYVSYSSSDIDSVQVSPSAYTKVKEIKTLVGFSTCIVNFALKSTAGGNLAYGRIYINNIAVGTERSTTSATYVWYNEVINNINANDLIQIYIKKLTDYKAQCAYFRIGTLVPIQD